MDLGFETIGNATVICHDGGPVLATDPWLGEPAYFGSWVLSHQIPEAQLSDLRACRYLWISHGHPDHLSPASLKQLPGKQILLPDHYGGRIANFLRSEGYDVRVLADGQWTQLSNRLRVCSVADFNQDAMLLIELGGRLIIDANDATDRGIAGFLAANIANYEDSYLLWLTGYGDADMINFFDEQGNRILPAAAAKSPIGPTIAEVLHAFQIENFVPASSMHKYHRTDSAWANEYTTPADAHGEGFESDTSRILPPFVHRDFANDEISSIGPPPTSDELQEPEAFGDRWSDELEAEDVERLRAYLAPVTHLRRAVGYVNFRVGGRDNVIDINRAQFDRGYTFEVPRASLMTAVEHQVFDDLLIGNFMRTIVHGDFGCPPIGALYPDFTPFLAKFGDNGDARSMEELRAYFARYRDGGFFGFAGNDAAQAEAQAVEPYL